MQLIRELRRHDWLTIEQKTEASGGGGEGAGPAVRVAGTVQYERRMRCVRSVWGERRAAQKSRGELVQ